MPDGKGSGVISIQPKYELPIERVEYTSYHDDLYFPEPFVGGYSGYAYYESKSSSTVGRLHNVSEYHIGYSDVTETLGDGSKIHYHFSSRLDVPDNESLRASTQNRYYRYDGTLSSLSYPDFLEKDGLYNANDLSAFRGKLLKKTMYSPTNEQVQVQEYTYNTDERLNDYEVSIAAKPFSMVANLLYYTPCRLIEERQEDRNGVETIKLYEYNAKNLVSKQRTVQSNGDTLQLSYVYPFEKNGDLAGTSYLADLIADNQIGSPVVTVKSLRRKNATKDQVLTATKFNYNKYESIQVLKSTLAEWSINSSTATDYSLPNGSFSVKEQYLNYDKIGNITYMVDKNNIPVVYLWSFRGQYPVAEIKGATYTEVETALTASFIHALWDSASPTEADMQKVNALRTNTTLGKAQVSTYTYKPLIGLLTATDPAGLTSTYEYDALGRLLRIKDPAGKVIEDYEYNYIR
jgi:YD repeat-containing protein